MENSSSHDTKKTNEQKNPTTMLFKIYPRNVFRIFSGINNILIKTLSQILTVSEAQMLYSHENLQVEGWG